MVICSTCGNENSEGARFCNECGASLARSPAREVRKTVTVLFADVAGSTALGERIDPESLRRVMARYFETARACLERHGATVEKFIGDAVMAVFGVPTVHEDDALRAVRAASELRESLSSLNKELERDYGVSLQVRVGVNTGGVIVGTEERLATGDAVNIAARLEQAAQPGEILLGEPTFRLARDAIEVEAVEPLSLKGKAEPFIAHRLLRVVEGALGFERRFDGPLVGRREELALVRSALEQAVSERRCRLVTVLGPPGIGKSRLAREVAADFGGDAVVLVGRCLPYGEGITYSPLREIFAAADAEDELEAALGADAAEEIFWAVRKAVERRARERPLALVVDDIHWAEPTLLDLIEHLADWTRDAQLLLLCLARPELLDERPAWGASSQYATTLTLEPLAESEADELIESLLGGSPLDEEARTRIRMVAEGNPLFVEQLLALLAEGGEGRPRPVDDPGAPGGTSRRAPRGRARLARARVRRGPRVRMGGARRACPGPQTAVGVNPGGTGPKGADPAARGGRGHVSFPAHADPRRRLRAHFQGAPRRPSRTLRRLARRQGRGVRGDRRLPPRAGIPLPGGARAAGRPRAEARRQAAERLAASGWRAKARGDTQAAANLLERATTLLPPDDRRRLRLLPTLGRALREAGQMERADAVLSEAVERGGAAGERGVAADAGVALSDLRFHRPAQTGVGREDVLRELDAAIPVFDELGDEAGLARALCLGGKLRFWGGEAAAAIEAFERAARYARDAGDHAEEAESLQYVLAAMHRGPMPVDEALGRLEEIRPCTEANRRLEIALLKTRAKFEAMRGRFDIARDLTSQARALAEEHGLQVLLDSHVGPDAGAVELLAGDAAAAEHELRPACEGLERIGELSFLASVAPLLVDAVLAQGRNEEALQLTERWHPERLTVSEDADAQVGWRRVRAKVLARRGEFDEAERLGREAVRIAAGTDYLDARAKAAADLAEVLRLARRPEESAAALEEAIRLYDKKGNVVAAGTLRALLAEPPIEV